MNIMQQNDTSMKLPKIGDRLLQVMTSTLLGSKDGCPEPCEVVYINKPKRHFTVRFVDTGIKENYKVPQIDTYDIVKEFQVDFKKAFGREAKGIYIYESGALYPTVSDCAEAIGVQPHVINNHLNGQSSHVKGYHIFILE